MDRCHVCMYKYSHTLSHTRAHKADCVWVGRRRSRAKGKPRCEPFENCVLRVAQTWLNGIFPLPREFCGQLKRKKLYTHTSNGLWRQGIQRKKTEMDVICVCIYLHTRTYKHHTHTHTHTHLMDQLSQGIQRKRTDMIDVKVKEATAKGIKVRISAVCNRQRVCICICIDNGTVFNDDACMFPSKICTYIYDNVCVHQAWSPPHHWPVTKTKVHDSLLTYGDAESSCY